MTTDFLSEWRGVWLPNITDDGMERLIELLEKSSPLLISGCFTKTPPMGCLATHVAWLHPATQEHNLDAGIVWLHKVAGLNPATSKVLGEWDRLGAADLSMRLHLLAELKQERRARARTKPKPSQMRQKSRTTRCLD